jgi:mRNA-degrading endonuclease RelE of RelBE toxin-antitoxin system
VKYRIALDIGAKKFLSKLPSHIARQIGNKIDALAKNPAALKAEPVKGQKNLWRIRSGDYIYNQT